MVSFSLRLKLIRSQLGLRVGSILTFILFILFVLQIQRESLFKRFFNGIKPFSIPGKIGPLQFSEVNCMSFLTSLFHAGQGYSVFNTARSALSTFLESPSGSTIGNSSLIKRFMEGVFELRPSLPRYKYIWDVSIVLDFLRYYPNDDLSLTVLTLKCVMLLAFASMQRVQTLNMLQVSSIKIFSYSVVIPVDALLKHSRANRNSFSVVLKAFPCDVLCPCYYVKALYS